MSSRCPWWQWLYPWVMVTEVGSESSPKTHCFGDTTQNDDKWEKEMGSCPKDIRWLVVCEHDICGLIRKALRRLDTRFPKLLSGGERGEERLAVRPWDLLQVHLDQQQRGGVLPAAPCRGAAGVPSQQAGWRSLTGVFPPMRRACYFIRNLRIKA